METYFDFSPFSHDPAASADDQNEVRTRLIASFRRLLAVSKADCRVLALCRHAVDFQASPTPSEQDAQEEVDEDDDLAKKKKEKGSKEQLAREEKAAKVSFPG